MKKQYIAPDFEKIMLTLSRDILDVSIPEYTIPEEGGDLPRTGDPDDDLFG